MSYKQKFEKIYHIFSNGVDEMTPCLKKAVKIARELCRKHGCVRIYEETEWDKEEGLFQNEDCILSFGAFPS